MTAFTPLDTAIDPAMRSWFVQNPTQVLANINATGGAFAADAAALEANLGVIGEARAAQAAAAARPDIYTRLANWRVPLTSAESLGGAARTVGGAATKVGAPLVRAATAPIVLAGGLVYGGAKETWDQVPTEEYARRLGIDPSNVGEGFWKDFGIRMLGAMPPIASNALGGAPGWLAEKVGAHQLAEVLGNVPAAQAPAPVAVGARPANPTPGVFGQYPFVLPRMDTLPTEPQPSSVAAQPPAVRRGGAFAGGGTGAAPVAAVAPTPPAAAPVEGQLMPRTGVDDGQIRSEIARMDDLTKDYERRTGEIVPKDLAPMDKWMALAKGLGVAAMVAAFPGFGALAALGAGGLMGASSLDQRRRDLEAGAQQQRETMVDLYKQRGELQKTKLGALGDVLTAEGDRDKTEFQRQWKQREFDAAQAQALRNEAMEQARMANAVRVAGVQAAGAGERPQLVTLNDGSLAYVSPRGVTNLGVSGQVAGRRGGAAGVSYNIPEAIRQRAALLMEKDFKLTPIQALSMARQQVTSEIPLSFGGGGNDEVESGIMGKYGQ